MAELSQKQLKSFLKYNPTTGEFTYLKYRNRNARAGQTAGRVHWKGYRYIMIDRKSYAAHRLAFLYMEGAFPTGEVDHINCIKHDNRFCNLRVCSRAENIRNSPSYRGLLPKGVCSTKYGFVARITVNYKRIHLGTFNTVDEAEIAYQNAAKRYHGDYANTKKMAIAGRKS